MTTKETEMKCGRCGSPNYSDPEPHERLVQDRATGRIYCAFCADELSRIAHGVPAIIRHQDGSAFSWSSKEKAKGPARAADR